jgi:hypothetical protein
MLDLRHIHPLTDFLRNHKEHVSRLKESGTPEVLTINGRAELVLQDAESYQELLDRLDRAETLAALRQALDEEARGKMRPAREALEELRRKHAIPG